MEEKNYVVVDPNDTINVIKICHVTNFFSRVSIG